jgi:periplasmic divalent cation tolerance protein
MHLPLLILVQCPVPTEAVADAISTALLTRRLAASVHVRPVSSRYRWAGAVQTAREYVLDIKTTRSTFDAVANLIRELHPYELPGIWALPVEASTPEYGSWIAANVDSVAPPTDSSCS